MLVTEESFFLPEIFHRFGLIGEHRRDRISDRFHLLSVTFGCKCNLF